MTTTTNTVPAWTCPKCGTTHPITVSECCTPSEWRMRKPHEPYAPPTIPTGCLHDACPDCRNGTCHGIHMISCPCPKCSPRC